MHTSFPEDGMRYPLRSYAAEPELIYSELAPGKSKREAQ